MTPTHQATLDTVRDSFGMFSEAIKGLSDEALSWRPDAENTNSLAVLAAHSITATRFWLGLGAGVYKPIGEYRREDRGPSFAVTGGRAEEFAQEFEQTLAGLTALLANGTEANLVTHVAQPDDPSMSKTGAGCLVHGVGHLREHVGQAQLMRDLWLAMQR